MRNFFLLLLIAPSFQATGQFAIITDRDGYTNVRSDSQKNSRIIDTLHNDHLIYILEKEGTRVHIEYTRKQKELSGYVYNDRFTAIAEFNKIPVYSQRDNQIIFRQDSMEITISAKLFKKSLHKFKYYSQALDEIEFIDNKKYWGTDGELPSSEYEAITIRTGMKTMRLSKSALQNLYQPDLAGMEINIDEKKNTLFIHAMNSDGAGFYEVTWVVKKGVYLGRLIAYGF